MSAHTHQQRNAIGAAGNVLVVAGAGTGKTHTVIERCLARVCAAENPVSLDNVLLVTFTEAAAAEMRKRLREELERRAAASPEDVRLAEQLALVETARISTLHSFCLRVAREHCHELKLDPELTVLAEEQARLLGRETLSRLLERYYAGEAPNAEAVRQFLLDYGRGWDLPIRKLILRLHDYTQTLRDPEGWFEEELARLDEDSPPRWLEWLGEAFQDWKRISPAMLREQPRENAAAHECADLLDALPGETTREQMAAALSTIIEQLQSLIEPKTKPRGSLDQFFDEAAFLRSLAAPRNGRDPLIEDWNWMRPPMKAVLTLTREFSAEFSAAKRELAAVDFHDLEQFALQLLLDRRTGRPSPLAQQWRQRLQLLFVDEYQDINAAQDAILRALGGEGEQANRFMVGDVKQSIYRFRLADPRIFQRYMTEWTTKEVSAPAAPAPEGQTIGLTENFRSHEAILNFVNALFAALMRGEAGGVTYDEPQRLRFGARDARGHYQATTGAERRVELHLILAGQREAEGGDSENGNESSDLTSAEREARLVALRLRDLKEQGYRIWDKRREQFRPVEWGDMAVLLRSPRNKAEGYAKAFERTGVPLVVARGGFFESMEALDLLNLLRALDNPLQDLPLLAALRSPLAGLTMDELATVRLAERRGPFWTALLKCRDSGQNWNAALQQKIGLFLNQFARWRQLARQASLSRCLEAVLDDTQYEDWLCAQTRGRQRSANARRFLALTRKFDQFQRQGLFRFLRFVEAQLDAEADLESAPPESGNAVQLMSIHQSKGLDFPIVVAADLGKRFNFEELKERVILDEALGVCPKIKPPGLGQAYPSLPYWLAQRHQRRELLGEEIRLLYVALTRARDLLILTGTTNKFAPGQNPAGAAEALSPHEVLRARGVLDWLRIWLPRATGWDDWTQSGQTELLKWEIHPENEQRLLKPSESPSQSAAGVGLALSLSPKQLEELSRKLAWRYPFQAAADEPAKTSVSALRRRFREESDDEARKLFPDARGFTIPRRDRGQPGRTRETAAGLSAADIGIAHHLLLQRMSLQGDGSLQCLKEEAGRLRRAALLSDAEFAALDLDGVAAFCESQLGRFIRAQLPDRVHREMPFTVKMSPGDFQALKLPVCANLAPAEFVVVQGVVDLAVILPGEIRLVDFKTDAVPAGQMSAKVAEYGSQLRLYALALERIYARSVTERWLYFLSSRRAELVPA